MSLVYNESIAHGTKLGIWKKEEELELLESVYFLKDYEHETYDKISNENRKKEWLSTRILLTELIEKRADIKYNNNGSPYIENNFLNISISHSKNFIAIITSKFYKPGIDIEHISDRPKKIKHKFLNSDELNWCRTDLQLTAAWSAKEAVFKTFEKELDFHDMIISEHQLFEDKGILDIEVVKPNKQKSFSVNYMIIENDILTYTLTQV